MKHIAKVGLEIEGGWFKPPATGFHGDGSIRFPKHDYKIRGTTNKIKRIHLGEMSSPPFSTLEEADGWIDNQWPDKRNETCGFHIHVSLHSKGRYLVLMNKDFYDKFLQSADEFARRERMSKSFYKRLEGSNTFCKRAFNPEVQVQLSGKNPERYTHLNYCFNLHGTIENRLPCGAMPRGKAKKTVRWFINLIEDYLNANFKETEDEEKTEHFEVEERVFAEESLVLG